MDKILVGSVFKTHERLLPWYNLQTNNLKNFDRIICSDSNQIPHSLTIDNHTNYCLEHMNSLNKILVEMKSLQQKYKYFLILDSDCFPINKNFIQLLVAKMKDKKFASTIRLENLDTFYHPSVLFGKMEYIHECPPFEYLPYLNLMGENHIDVTIKLQLIDTYPLIRTNKINLHPLFGAIYGNLFYHHGCGSRNKAVRCNRYYGLSVDDSNKIDKEMFDALIINPKRFINGLMYKSYKEFI